MIEINPGILAAQVITFLIGLFLIWKIFLGPLTQKLEQRKGGIARDISEAENNRLETENLKKEYERQLASIEEKAGQILKKALDETEISKEQILKSAREQAQLLLDKTAKQLEEERQKMLKSVKNEVAGLGIMIAEKLMEKTADKNTQKKMLDQVINELEKK